LLTTPALLSRGTRPSEPRCEPEGRLLGLGRDTVIRRRAAKAGYTPAGGAGRDSLADYRNSSGRSRLEGTFGTKSGQITPPGGRSAAREPSRRNASSRRVAVIESRTTHSFRTAFAALPQEIQDPARRSYRLFRADPRHPSLRFTPGLPLFTPTHPTC